MKNLILTKIFLLLSLIAISQNKNMLPFKYFVKFKDKNGTPYTISNPQQFLSQRAIERRNKFNIAIDEFDLPCNPQYIQQITQTGVLLISRTKWLNGVIIYTDDTTKINLIKNLPFVSDVKLVGYATQSYINKMMNKNKENYYTKHFEIDLTLKKNKDATKSKSFYDYGLSENQISMIKGDVLHDMGYRGQGMVIAVLDAGFTHVNTLDIFAELRNNGRILGKWNFVENDTNVYQGSTHGTHVLSVMGGYLPGQLIGTAPEASYWLLRSEDASSEYIVEEYFWASAAEFADSVGADLINSSLGYTVFDDTLMNHTYADMDGNKCPSSIAADIAASRGMIVCNSAGNSGNKPWRYISAPADADSIICIGAVNKNGEYVSFSSIGPSYDNQIKPTVVAQGEEVVIASTSSGITTGSGTSFSSPIVCGAIASLWQMFPNKSNMEIINAVIQSASRYNNPDSTIGYGIPNFSLAYLILTNIPKIPDKDSNFIVYPNPFKDSFNIVYFSSRDELLKIELIDMINKNILTTESITVKANTYYKITKNLNFLKSGTYILTIKSPKREISKLIAKI